MNKIILILKIILKAKIIFKSPKKYDLIVFDKASAHNFRVCFSKIDYFILQSRSTSINEIYISYEILQNIIKNFFKGNIFTVYLISLIKVIKPKVIITNNDNSLKFSDLAKILDKEINFIAVQNASRVDLLEYLHLYETKKMKDNILKKFYIPNFYCFGDYEKDLYKKLDIKSKDIYPVGSLRWANFLQSTKSKNYSLEEYSSDICLVPETFAQRSHKSISTHPIASKLYTDGIIEKGFAKIIQYTITFCIKNKMKLIVLGKRDIKFGLDGYNLEIDFFKRNLSHEEFSYLEKNFLQNNRDDFSSYKGILNSKVTVGICSTLLKDKLASGGKILSCNLTNQNMYNFPFNGILTLNNCSYEDFEKRLLEIYSISEESFFSKMEQNTDYIMKFRKDYSTIDLIRKKIFELGVAQN